MMNFIGVAIILFFLSGTAAWTVIAFASLRVYRQLIRLIQDYQPKYKGKH